MNPIALIAEDEPLLAEHLKSELQQLWPELALLPIAPHGQAAVDLALARRPSLCFLDIRMPGLSGLEAAAALAEDWPDDTPFPLLVFVTAFDQYALQAFEHAAVDYVLKPVQRERLAQTVARLKQALAQRQASASPPLDATLAQLRQLLAPASGVALAPAPAVPRLRLLQVSQGSSIQMVPVEDVLFFEAADKYVRVVTAQKEHLMRLSLRELLPQLDTELFWQVHRGTVVKAAAIERAVRDEQGKLTLHLRAHPEKLGVSRLYAHLFRGL
ncbi:LytTR family DNA-binding domain-containing protein [Pelomonas sp. APW6]|uniref:LytTR family DNA-binding domain-containing protein n=1 Tax=Roseateles subflavus TaxID=3053353 RepID=A0ABT7LLC3_9BURK|nr:LytTR family DNA-binding domain-containing protein [Pelomonas sp. APW6]MDL5033662.1 LytTR family DNA-binding domain-containing protein [Pelomonas sp. APW6]